MTTSPTRRCPRLFEVEALRDGRLSGAEIVRFRAHLGICQDCAREAGALDALAAELRRVAVSANSDELRVRRERTRLLAAFDATLVPIPHRRRRRVFVQACAAVGAIGLALVFWLARPRGTVTARTNVQPVSAAESVTIRADSSARWTRQTEAHLERIVLESGALSIRVDHARSPRQLLVVLPDGELEDIGTTFSVSADAGRTTRVTVQEGSVVLRVRGNAIIALAAGDSWTRPAPVAPVPSTVPPELSSAVPSAKLRPTVHLAPSTSGPPDPVPARDADQVAGPSAAVDHSADFSAAMGEFNAGNYGVAANLFGTYVTTHPGDPRAEDAAYLRVLAVQHLANAGAIRQAARDYLSRYPRGFRRAEVEALSRE